MKQPFSHHIQELRRRLLWPALVVLAGALAAYLVRDPLLGWLQAPLHESLYYTRVTGAFEFLMSACFLAGVLLAIPVLMYNLLAFVQPALPRPWSRRQASGLVALSTGLTLLGVAFGYYVTLPGVIGFLNHLDVSHLHALIAADSYLKFVVMYLAVFAVVFQLPLIMLTIDRITPLPPQRLRRARKWVIVGAFGAALVLPVAPDPVSQFMLAVPVVVMFEVSLGLLWLRRYRRRPVVVGAPPVVEQPVPVPAGPRRAVRRSARVPLGRLQPAGPKIIDLRGRP